VPEAHEYKVRTNMPFSLTSGTFVTTPGAALKATLVRSCGRMRWSVSVNGATVAGGVVKTGPRTLVRVFIDGDIAVSKVGKKVGC
jgi:hypothetical protein